MAVADARMPVPDAELVAEFMRTVETDDGVLFQIAMVEWDGPHSPIMTWRTFRCWKRPPTATRLAAAQQKALAAPRFFRICERCGERNLVGHMHDRHTCQSCAEEYLGVVY